jgi:hypothetical protein
MQVADNPDEFKELFNKVFKQKYQPTFNFDKK